MNIVSCKFHGKWSENRQDSENPAPIVWCKIFKTVITVLWINIVSFKFHGKWCETKQDSENRALTVWASYLATLSLWISKYKTIQKLLIFFLHVTKPVTFFNRRWYFSRFNQSFIHKKMLFWRKVRVYEFTIVFFA